MTEPQEKRRVQPSGSTWNVFNVGESNYWSSRRRITIQEQVWLVI